MDSYLTVRQAAEYLGVTEESIRYWITDKQLPAKRRGLRALVVSSDDLRNFARDHNMVLPDEKQD